MTDINYQIVLSRLRPPNDLANNWTFNQVASSGVMSRKAGETEFTPDTNMVYSTHNYMDIVWGTTPVLTQQECEDEWGVYQSELATEAAHEKRRNEYPSWHEFAEAMYDAMDNGTLPKVEPWFTDCKTVKDNNPLP